MRYATDRGILNQTPDPILRKEIEDKIDALFTFDRFYFYKSSISYEGEDTNQATEEEEI